MTADLPHTPGRAPASRPTAVEWCFVVAVLLAGFGLRAAWPSRLAVGHFDEGVYASNVFFSGERRDERYPNQHLYAPPLLPLLIEFAMLAAGPSNLTAMAVNVVAGSLTIPLVWWVGRRWFGPAAGLSAATLVAVNDVHIFFSRTALTDVLLVFWLVAAVYLFWEALAPGSRLALVASAAATGLAWWTKYNGWLPLAIGLAAVVPWNVWTAWAAVCKRPGPGWNVSVYVRSAALSIAKWGVVALLAFLIWSPWLWSLQDKGGYQAVMANHRGYVVGLAGWSDSVSRQATKLARLDGWPSLHGPLLAGLVCLLYARYSTGRSTWNVVHRNRPALVALVAVFGLSLVVGSAVVLGVATLSGIVWYLFGRLRPEASDRSQSSVLLAGWLVAAWFIGLSLTTALYTPYPRLTLPWLAAGCLGAGIVIGWNFGPRAEPDNVQASASGTAETADLDSSHSLGGRVRVSAVLGLVGGLAVLAILEPFALRRTVPGWERRTGIAVAVP